jgi:hypothetical protein
MLFRISSIPAAVQAVGARLVRWYVRHTPTMWYRAIRRPWQRLVLLTLLTLVVSGCGRAATTPMPEVVHRWSAPPVVISLARKTVFNDLPRLVLYADGTVIRTRDEYTGTAWRRFIDRAQLPPADLCTLLSQIDATGFFTVNPADYVPPSVVDGTSTIIRVDAWQSGSISAYALDSALDESLSDVVVPPGLAATYRLLATYAPPNPMPYHPERIVVDVRAIAATDVPAIVATGVPTQTQPPVAAWPVAGVVLADLVTQTDPLAGPPAAAMYDVFTTDSAAGRFYQEDGQIYSVSVRPLLPYEVWPSSSPQRLTTFAMTPTVPLACPGS